MTVAGLRQLHAASGRVFPEPCNDLKASEKELKELLNFAVGGE